MCAGDATLCDITKALKPLRSLTSLALRLIPTSLFLLLESINFSKKQADGAVSTQLNKCAVFLQIY